MPILEIEVIFSTLDIRLIYRNKLKHILNASKKLYHSKYLSRAVAGGRAGGGLSPPPRFFAKGKEFGNTVNITKKKTDESKENFTKILWMIIRAPPEFFALLRP